MHYPIDPEKDKKIRFISDLKTCSISPASIHTFITIADYTIVQFHINDRINQIIFNQGYIIWFLTDRGDDVTNWFS